ncbi:hypothetical protein K2P47_04175 [Patescibacteria group bacterium]|nr:hypothetical protein [Patescibacteria group bacterium]
MSDNTIPLQISIPPRETAFINHDGALVLTYRVARKTDGREWIDLDSNRVHEANLTVCDTFNFVFNPGKTPLLQQLIKRARECFDPAVLEKEWVMETKPSGQKGYVNATIAQHVPSNFGDPVLRFADEGTHWLETYFYS